MKINARKHLEIRLHHWLFTVLFLGVVGVLAWLSTRHYAQFDWTAEARNTLSPASLKVLSFFREPVQVSAYARDDKTVREYISGQVARYTRFNPNVSLRFVNPDTSPDLVREQGIADRNELRIDYQGRSEKVNEPSEAAITNALQRLAHAQERHVVFLEGHGERSPTGQANFDLGQFGEELRRKGLGVTMLKLAITPDIPGNADVLVIDGPKVNLLPGEISKIQDYVKRGGNLWWMAEPGDLHGLNPLAEQLGVAFLPGTAVDASTQLFGIDDPTFALVAEYTPHAVTQNFDSLTLFPTAAAIERTGDSGFEYTPFLKTVRSSWTETGPIEGKIKFEAERGEREGPLTIGVALTRPKPGSSDNQSGQPKTAKEPAEQRVVVIGDGDFLANTYLGNGGNLNLGLNILQWLSQNDDFINIPAKTAGDKNLQLSNVAGTLIPLGFLILLPLSLFIGGAILWYRRRGR